MGRLEIFYSFIKALLLIALAIVLFANMFEYQPLSREARTIIIVLVLLEAIVIIRKIDNRNH
ncbi:hypothetical protein J416_02399 [Gracilibacillus halophilus YIM-C55.5]|uniref:Uncharacterized protein n=1 Tax=Gracilibacillus halophilus YIM-C55.5 TaxID=1308866 RepID=N4WPP0_9BACI|nr:hypothetical protein [Gracilibacillus halophilus]ENH98057.1 hypothetical protein J416_02399 [Gracilibacillus halophilus YIM-C55.5]